MDDDDDEDADGDLFPDEDKVNTHQFSSLSI